jgi:hypothetical protein
MMMVTSAPAIPAPRMALVQLSEITELPLAKLKHNKVQPTWRTKLSPTMTRLCNSIKTRGLLNPACVALIDGEYILIDGHRRRQAHELLGMKTIRCRIAKVSTLKEAEALFAELDQTTMKQGGKDRLYGWAHATDRKDYLSVATSSQSGVIGSFVRIFGEKRAVEHAKAGVNPSVAQCTYQLARFLGNFLGTDRNVPKLRQIGEWIIAHRAVDVSNSIVRVGRKAEAERVLKHINGNTPMVLRKKGSATR